MLADEVDYVIGVDTHKTKHSAAAVSPTGALVAHTEIAADAFGYKRLLRFAKRDATGASTPSSTASSGSRCSSATRSATSRSTRRPPT